MNSYKFTYSIYQRPFRQPLKTSHGVWEVRAGIIIQLTDDLGRCHPGEIAPIPWFGSESIEQASDWCQQIGDNITASEIDRIPDDLPACQFGFGSALMAVNLPPANTILPNLDISALLPSGADAIARFPALYTQGYSTFKWKIGVLPIDQEMAIWKQFMTTLPVDAKLRLDANGGLTYAEAEQWLKICSQEARIEFLEQPLAVDSIEQMQELAGLYDTPIALDESVATFNRIQAAYTQGWRGIYVIKPGIAGFPWRLAEFITQYQLDVVFSSVMETSVGRDAAFQLASRLNLRRSMGFGIDEWFGDPENSEGKSKYKDLARYL
ncbi:o-succinylbenzoate synthase [Chamaesiphon sp. VAR_48_metabat_135_sub]|uniref:o-succinylbenzoate synthase n=1 Tax=Chamaesiphon sp. VAR_48_metabat_135_sub TaxID=2964699 RepID=UPI00286C4739|nr:o-succinylbenzoate synthase [Chamaesiphon sp. VAR_48_metabat_135_sub]